MIFLGGKMDNGYFDLFAYKFRCWLGGVTRYIQNQQIKDIHYGE